MATSNFAIEAVTSAQKELAAFLRTVTEVFGTGQTQHATDLWLEAVEKAEQINMNAEKFFRRITIQTVHQLARDAKALPAYALLTLDTK